VRPRWSPGTRNRLGLVLALLAVLPLSACGGADEDGNQGASTPETTASARPPNPARTAGAPIRISFGDTQLTARLLGNATARDLAARLPLTLTFRDHNRVEKTAPLPGELSLDGAPEGHDPAAGDIGYYAPGGDFVLYYDDGAPYFGGIVRVGEFDGDLALVERLPEGASVTIQRDG